MKNNASIIYNVCLILGDSLALVVAFISAYILRVTLSHRVLSQSIHASAYLTTFLAMLPFFILIFALLGLYNNRIHEQRFSEIGRLLVGSFIGTLFIISYGYVTNTPIFPARLVVFYGFMLAFFFVLLFRTFARGLRRELFTFGIGINRVLLVGDTRLTHRMASSLSPTAITGYQVIGVVAGDKHPHPADANYDRYLSFKEAVAERGDGIHTIIQTELYSSNEKNDQILTYAQEHHIAYRFVPGNSELFTGNLEAEVFQSVPVITVHQTALVGWGRVVKRLFDILVAGLGLLLASPILLLIAVAVKVSDGGPVLFRQERLSRFDRKVYIFKFRSMRTKFSGMTPEAAFTAMGRPELIHQYRNHSDSLPHDPRISRLGHFLRTNKLDELPQLYNVLRGDISLVGPRALVAEELNHFSQKNLILSVKSGLTGLAQVSGQTNISFDERRKLDLYYVQNWRFTGDLIILIRTIWIVLSRKGTR